MMNITLICVPYELDMARWGYVRGPLAFLEAGLVERLRERSHRVGDPIWVELPREERTRDAVTNLGRIAAQTSDAVRDALARSDGFALVLEGDCSHAAGVIGGLAQAAGTAGVAWFDAHGDLQTMATSESGYIGGMAYSVALGWEFDDWRLAAGVEPAVRAEAAALLGTSDLDDAEIEALRRHPFLQLTAVELETPGAAKRLETALRSRADAAPAWYLHVDLDVAGPEEVPGGLTPAPHWPSRKALFDALEATARALPVRAAAIATYNPVGDPAGRGAQFGVDVALALLDALDAGS
jgi:arginase